LRNSLLIMLAILALAVIVGVLLIDAKPKSSPLQNMEGNGQSSSISQSVAISYSNAKIKSSVTSFSSSSSWISAQKSSSVQMKQQESYASSTPQELPLKKSAYRKFYKKEIKKGKSIENIQKDLPPPPPAPDLP